MGQIINIKKNVALNIYNIIFNIQGLSPCPSLARSPTSPIPSIPMPLAPPATSYTSSPAPSVMPYMWGKLQTVCPIKWMATSPHPTVPTTPLMVTIHTKSHQLPFNSCWNVHVLHNLSHNTNHNTHRHLELICQFVLSARHNPGINLRSFLCNILPIPSTLPLLLSHTHLGGTYPKLSWGPIFIVCSHTFTLFWLRKISVIVETFQLSFRVFICAFHLEISSFFW